MSLPKPAPKSDFMFTDEITRRAFRITEAQDGTAVVRCLKLSPKQRGKAKIGTDGIFPTLDAAMTEAHRWIIEGRRTNV